MKANISSIFILLITTGIQASAQTVETNPILHIYADQMIAPVSPVFSGMMTEEINHSYDGGLYAELVQNRAFNDDTNRPIHWKPVRDDHSKVELALDSTNGLNGFLPMSLRLDISEASPNHLAGVANEGYWGIPVRAHTQYRGSFYAKADSSYNGSVRVSLQSPDGVKTFCKAEVKFLTSEWRKFTFTLATPGGIKTTSDARIVLAFNSPGKVWLNLVSLFPPTWNKRPNGNRIDVMQKLADMKPAFLRFPGGNYLEGSSIADRFVWQQTLGELSQRPGHPSCWGYRSSDGMGLLEFLKWAEDLGAEPVLAVYAGYSLGPKNELVKPGPDLAPFVKDALDEIEYVMGPTDTFWGARRVADGHPKPFKLHYIEIGNEDWFDPALSYDARFTQFYDAIKSKYPQLSCISTIGNEQPENKRVHSRKPDLLDEHYYWLAADFAKEAVSRFDKYDRNGPKIFVGEWAAYEEIKPWEGKSQQLPPTPMFQAALGDAAWITGMERNSDIIPMQCYAPMLVNVNPGARQWRPNLIGYDVLQTFGSPSYYVIKMFNANHGDQVIKTRLDSGSLVNRNPLNYSVTKEAASGMIYIKLVNAAPQPRHLRIDLNGVKKVRHSGEAIVLQADNLDAINSTAAPEKIVPVTSKLKSVARNFTYELPPNSITVLKIATK